MYKMSYGTILLMAFICFFLGGSGRTPWTAMDEREPAGVPTAAQSAAPDMPNEASAAADESDAVIEAFSIESIGMENAGSVAVLSLDSPVNDQTEEERQSHAYLRLRALCRSPFFAPHPDTHPIKCGTEP